MSPIARAQTYPTRPVRLVVGFAAGSSTDILGRLIGLWLSERLGQQFIVDNRPGASGNIGAEVVVKSPADGYTLLMVSPPYAINATLFDKLSYNFLRDITAVAGVVRVPNIMVVNPSVPAMTVPEFINFARTNQVSFASAGIGTVSHLAGELFNGMAGINMVHVAYRGDGPAMTDLIGGHVQVAFATMTTSIEYIRTGKLRPLGVTTVTGSPVLPDVPTVGTFVEGYEASSWFGVGAPNGMATAMVDALNRAINEGLADPRIRERLTEMMGGMVLTGSPADFGKLVGDETEKWGKVIKSAGIKA